MLYVYLIAKVLLRDVKPYEVIKSTSWPPIATSHSMRAAQAFR